ncbi:MAG: TrbG/VirB9 family P-type conjugative transfer protein [Novosphingobium sp.]
MPRPRCSRPARRRKPPLRGAWAQARWRPAAMPPWPVPDLPAQPIPIPAARRPRWQRRPRRRCRYWHGPARGIGSRFATPPPAKTDGTMMKMKALLPLFALAVPAALSSAHAEDTRLVSHMYDENEVVRIDGKLGVQATIGFAEDEHIENVAVGDAAKWQITPNSGPTRCSSSRWKPPRAPT